MSKAELERRAGRGAGPLACVLLCAGILAVSLPFWIRNSLLEWDLVGHYFTAQYLRDHLLPMPYGWNPLFFGGYPEGTLYPSLFHYLAALLGVLLGVGAAFKLLVLASVLLAPLSFYYFLRSFRLSEIESALGMVVLWSLMAAAPQLIGYDVLGRRIEAMGGDLYSTLRVGLVTHAFGLPWFFFFAGAMARGFDAGRFRLASVFFALCVLSHVFSSMMAALFFATWTVARAIARRNELRRVAAVAFKTGWLAFLLTAWWSVPFLATIDQVSAAPIAFNSLRKILPIAAAGAAAWLLLRQRADPEGRTTPLFLFFLVLVNLVIYGDRRAWDIHFYRFHTYILLLSGFFVVAMIRRVWVLTAAACLALPAAALLQVRYLSAPRIEEPSFAGVPQRPGRTHVIAGEWDQPSARVLQVLYPWRTGNAGTTGLFVTSSRNAPSFEELLLRPPLQLDGIKRFSAEQRSAFRKRFESRCRLLGIDAILTCYRLESYLDPDLFRGKRLVWSFRPVRPDLVGDDRNQKDGRLEYYEYEMPPAPMVEPVDSQLRAVPAGWDDAFDTWMKEYGAEDYLLVADASVPPGAGTPARVTALDVSPRADRIRFTVEAPHPVPILVKWSYHPNWSGVADGRPIRIYRVSPHFMLVYARGRVELSYGVSGAEIAGIFGTACGLFLLAAGLRRKQPAAGDRNAAEMYERGIGAGSVEGRGK